MSFRVTNALVIRPGNIIAIPSKEPISAVTKVYPLYSTNPLVETITSTDDTYKFISLNKALEVIPGSKVIYYPNLSTRYFVLPEGFPQDGSCPCKSVTDYYKIMADNADIGKSEFESKDQSCDQFDYGWC